jgi:hypothetical protein
MDGIEDGILTIGTGKQRKNRAKEFRGVAKKTGGADKKKK